MVANPVVLGEDVSGEDINTSHCWKVVGGLNTGGILVRKGPLLSSAQEPERLSHGALVQELERTEGRLLYRRVDGSGPDTGWVSIKVAHRDLLVRANAELIRKVHSSSQQTLVSSDSDVKVRADPCVLPSTPVRKLPFGHDAVPETKSGQKDVTPTASQLSLFRYNIDRVCRLHGLRVEPMVADGNCQFRAIAFHLLGDQEKHHVVREKVVQWLRAHAWNYKTSEMLEGLSVQQYCARMLQGTDKGPTWGDFLTLQAIADMEGRPIQLLSNHSAMPMKSIYPMRQRTEKAIVLTYILDMHYDAAVPDEESEYQPVETFPFHSCHNTLQILE